MYSYGTCMYSYWFLCKQSDSHKVMKAFHFLAVFINVTILEWIPEVRGSAEEPKQEMERIGPHDRP